MRRGDLLSIKISDLKEDGIHLTPRKTANSTGKRMIIEWSSELREAIDDIKKLRRKFFSIWLFHTNMGPPYIKENGFADGFSSIWQRFMAKVLAKTQVTERFTEHDLRAKVASDTDGEHARRIVGSCNQSNY